MRWRRWFSPGSTARLALTQTAAGLTLVGPTTWIGAKLITERMHFGSAGDPRFLILSVTLLACLETAAFCPVLIAPVSSALRQLRDAQARLEKLADTDALTGLLNRRGLEKAGERLRSRAARRGELVAALLCDIDHFKRVNDVHGHEAGDGMLRAVGRLLAARFGGEAALAGRFGGEEFLVLLRARDPRFAACVAEALRRDVASLEVKAEGKTLGCTLSVGVAAAAAPRELAGLVSRADAALYRAKSEGRDRVVAA